MGEPALAETAAAMAQQCLAPGAPLRTLSLLLAGGPNAVLGGQAPSNGVQAPQPGAAALGSAPMGEEAGAAARTLLAAGDWRQQLAVVAANRTPGDERLLEGLGEALLAQGQVCAEEGMGASC